VAQVNDPHEIAELRSMIEDHKHWTGSALATKVLLEFNRILPRFVRVMPLDYKRVLEETAAEKAKAQAEAVSAGSDFGATRGFVDGVSPSEEKAKQGVNTSEQSPAAKPVKPEPKVVDLEDSMVAGTDQKKRVEKLDKTKGFMKYKRLAEVRRHAVPSRHR
jgi:glutamate synthase (NADPH/NADH)